MIFKSDKKQKVFDQAGAKGYKLAETKLNEIVKLEISKGGGILAHALPIDVTFYVISGKGFATIDGLEIPASKNDVLFVEANTNRAWENKFDEVLEILVVKTLAD